MSAFIGLTTRVLSNTCVLQCVLQRTGVCCSVCCSVLVCVAVCVAAYWCVLQCVLQRTGVCCSVCCSRYCPIRLITILYFFYRKKVGWTLQEKFRRTLQHTATHCNTHAYPPTVYKIDFFKTPVRCNTHCNTLQHTRLSAYRVQNRLSQDACLLQHTLQHTLQHAATHTLVCLSCTR